MATASRVYVIFDDGKAVALVRAASQAAAIRHVVGSKYEAVAADVDHIIAYRNLEVQTAGDAQETAGAA